MKSFVQDPQKVNTRQTKADNELPQKHKKAMHYGYDYQTMELPKEISAENQLNAAV